MERVPHGIVERVGDSYVGYCDELGTSAHGKTLEEAFANLTVATQQALRVQDAKGGALGEIPQDQSADGVAYYLPSGTDPQSAALAAMTAMLLDGLGDYEQLGDEDRAS